MSSTQTRKVALLQYGCKTQNDQKHIFVNQIQRAALKNLSNEPRGDCSIRIMISLTYKPCYTPFEQQPQVVAVYKLSRPNHLEKRIFDIQLL